MDKRAPQRPSQRPRSGAPATPETTTSPRRQRISVDAGARPFGAARLRPRQSADDAERSGRGDRAFAGGGAALPQHAGQARLCRQAPPPFPAAAGSDELCLGLSRFDEPGRTRAAASAGGARRDRRQLLARRAERLRHPLSGACLDQPDGAAGRRRRHALSRPMRRRWAARCWRSRAKTCATTTSTPATSTAFTEHTVTSKADLRRILDEARKSGYAAMQDELDYGLVSLAVPILDETGRSHGGDQLLHLHLARAARTNWSRRACRCCRTRRGTSNPRCAASPICCARCIRADRLRRGAGRPSSPAGIRPAVPCPSASEALGEVHAPAHRLGLEQEAAGRIFGVVLLVEQVLRPEGDAPSRRPACRRADRPDRPACARSAPARRPPEPG